MISGSRKAILFDFDGTLAELTIDFPAMRAALFELLARYGVPEGHCDGLPVLETLDSAVALLAAEAPSRSDALSQDAHRLIEEIELQAASQGALFSETRMLLTELKRRSLATAVLTRNCRAAVRLVFPDIDRYCQAVIAREDTRHVKPHRDHLQAALQILQVSPDEAATVGDHPIDIQLGRQGGLFTIGVLTGHSEREALCAARADLILDKASQILSYLP